MLSGKKNSLTDEEAIEAISLLEEESKKDKDGKKSG